MNSDRTENTLPEATEDHDVQTDGDALRRIPVADTIRYRRRAQSAEKQVRTLADELTQANQRIEQMSQDLDNLRLEQRLTRKLSAAGAVDLEAAVLMARNRMEGREDADVDGCVEQLRRDKQYLFGPTSQAATSRKTAGARDRVTNNQTVLERAAGKAARTGSRNDLQEYLKLRRSLR